MFLYVFGVQVAASGDRDLWLAWIDALRDFEGSIGRSSLLGFFWDSNTSSGELPVLLLRGSTLSVLGENPEWMVRATVAVERDEQ